MRRTFKTAAPVPLIRVYLVKHPVSTGAEWTVRVFRTAQAARDAMQAEGEGTFTRIAGALSRGADTVNGQVIAHHATEDGRQYFLTVADMTAEQISQLTNGLTI